MAQISNDQKTNLQMVFNGLARYFKALNLPDDYQKAINEYMSGLWNIVKEYGTPENRNADTEESEQYWVKYVEADRELYDKYIIWSLTNQYEFIRWLHGFMFDLIQITERMKN